MLPSILQSAGSSFHRSKEQPESRNELNQILSGSDLDKFRFYIQKDDEPFINLNSDDDNQDDENDDITKSQSAVHIHQVVPDDYFSRDLEQTSPQKPEFKRHSHRPADDEADTENEEEHKQFDLPDFQQTLPNDIRHLLSNHLQDDTFDSEDSTDNLHMQPRTITHTSPATFMPITLLQAGTPLITMPTPQRSYTHSFAVMPEGTFLNVGQHIQHEPVTTQSFDIPSPPASPGKSKKIRWRPSAEQRQILEQYWLENQYPDQPTKQAIIQEIGGQVSYKQITSWFKHKRENDSHKGKFNYKYQPAMKFTPEQVKVLEDLFAKEPYAKGKALQDVARQLDVTDKRVQNWFKHKRSRLAQQGKFNYKPRSTLSDEQVAYLKDAFGSNDSPSLEYYEQLSNELNIKPEQIQKWFSAERSKKKRRKDGREENSDDEVPVKKDLNKRNKNTTTSSYGDYSNPYANTQFALPSLHMLDTEHQFSMPLGMPLQDELSSPLEDDRP